MPGQIYILNQSDGISVAAPSVFSGINAVSNANYTIIDTDGYRKISVTTGAVNRTITLPTAANNEGREITVYKADSGAGMVIISGTVSGDSTIRLGFLGCGATFTANAGSWEFKDNFYSSGTYTFAITGCTTSPTETVIIVRIGNAVTCTIKAWASLLTKDAVAGGIGVASLPTWARKATGSTQMRQIVQAFINNTDVVAKMILNPASGSLQLFNGIGSTNIPANTTNCGFNNDNTITWTVN